MNVLLIDSDPDLGEEVAGLLREVGVHTVSFRNAQLAFLYLLARFRDIDAIAFNVDNASGIRRRLEVLGPVCAVEYSRQSAPDGAGFLTAVAATSS